MRPIKRKESSMIGTLFLAFALLEGDGAPNTQGSGPTVVARLESPSREFRMSDRVLLSVAIWNETPEPFVVFGKLMWGTNGGLRIRIVDEEGAFTSAGVFADSMVTPRDAGDPSNYVKIPPGQFIGVYREDEARRLVPEPGCYHLWVQYRNPISSKYAEKLTGVEDVYGREQGWIDSNRVGICFR
jgi:hypothetical protein